MKRSPLSFLVALLAVIVVTTGRLNAQTWTTSYTPYNLGPHWQAIAMTDINTATIVGFAGSISKTTNGGSSWTAQSSGVTTDGALWGVSFANATTGIAVGRLNGIVTYNSIIRKTTNGGTTWTQQAGGEYSTDVLLGVSLADTNHAIAVGYATDSAVVMVTSNGGTNWTRSKNWNGNLYAIDCIDTTTATAVGSGGRVMRTTDGGVNWTIQTSGVSYALYGVSFSDANNGTAVGDFGTIIRTTNGGSSWTAQTSGTSFYLRGVSFTDANHGTAVGKNGGSGIVLRTNDGGANWVTNVVNQNSPYLGGVTGVGFAGSNNGIAIGENGLVLRTTNGASTTTASATTSAASSVDLVTATMNGSVNPYGANTTVRFRYGTTSGTYTDSVAATPSPISGLSNTSVSASLTGLAPNTSYYVRVVADNFLSYVTGNEVSFQTLAAQSPTISSVTPTAIWFGSATLNGTVNTHGASTVIRFLRGTVPGTYTDSVSATQSPLVDSTSNTVSAALAGLDTGATYFVRIAASNALFYERGTETSFATRSIPLPTLSTSAATGIGFAGATLNGSVNTHGASTVVRFLRGSVSGTYTDSVTATQSPLVDSTANAVSVAVAGLDTGATYYVRVAASNVSYYVRGDEVSFSTNPILPPTVTTTAATSIGSATAGLNGTLNTHGVSTFVQFLRGTSTGVYTDSVNATQSPLVDSTSNTVSVTATGLAPNTTYYTRVAARNSLFYERGNEVSFTTSSVASPTISSFVTSPGGPTSANLSALVNPYGTSTTVRFLWGTVAGTYTDSIAAVESPVLGSSNTSVSKLLTGLSAGTTYYVKVSASNSNYYVRSSESNFTTYAGQASGSVLTLDGSNDYVEVPDNDSLDISNAITIEAWVKFNNIANHWIVGKEPYNTSYQLFSDTYSGNKYIFQINGTQAIGGTQETGVWTHVAGTYDQSNLKLYINGELVATTALADPILVTSSPLHIGSLDAGYPAYPLDGSIDEIRIWNVARTQQQIREGMHRDLSDSTANMRAYFQFNEGSGSTTSSTVGSLTGTLINGPTWAASSVPVGEGTSSSVSAFTSGTANFGSISVTTTDAFDNAVDLTATSVAAAPNSLPSTYSSLLGNGYYIVRPFGTTGVFSTELSITFGASVLVAEANSYPGGLLLYRRSSNSASAWTLVAGADSADASTGFVRWSGITSFSQFAVVVNQGASGPVPVVVTHAATSVTLNSATLNGTVNALGSSATVRFLVGTAPGVYTDSVSALPSSLSDSNSVSYSMTSLTPGTTYYVRVSAVNNFNYAIGSEVSFATPTYETAGYTVNFDGIDDYISVADDDSLDITNAITLEAWVKINNLGNHWFIGKDPFNTAYQLFADTYSNAFLFQINGDGQILGGTPVTGVWTHVAGTYDGAELRLYVNGEVVASTSYSGPITTTSDPLKIGAFDYFGTPWYPMDGSIEEVRVWNVARTQQQIRENMHRIISSTDNLKAYFKFNEGSGTATSNYVSGPGGTLVNDVAWSASTAPLGSGSSTSIGSPITSGTALLGPATLTTTEDFDAAVDITGTTITAPPNVFPATYTGLVGDMYVVVSPFGTPGTFASTLSIDYGASSLDTNVTANPDGVRLYRRDVLGDGSWTLVGGADTANAASGYVRWSGITSGGQYAAVYEQSVLPVQLASFSASLTATGAHLTWMTATEVNTYGFEIERRWVRSAVKSGESVQTWTKAAFVEGHGTSTTPHEYSYTDNRLESGRYAYRLKMIDTDNSFRYSGEVEVEVGSVPRILSLAGNYPNPFNPSTTIEFTLPEDGLATLKVYNMLGQEVATLLNEALRAGVIQQRTFVADQLATGVYFARLEFGGNTLIRRLLLVK